MYFVVRTDVTTDSGAQRCFGVFDTPEDAQRMIDQLKQHMVGVFAVYQGAALV
jgi:hypothetical protein